MSPTGVTSTRQATESEGAVRYTLLGGRVGVSSRTLYLRTLADGLVWILVVPLAGRLLGRFGRRRWATATQRWWARRLQRALRVEIEWNGVELIDRQERYIVAPLHEGFGDALALLQLPIPLRFVVRDELLDWPLLGPYLRDTGQVAVSPEAGYRAYRTMLRAAPAIFAGGESLVVFPQGAILGIEIAFRRGPVALARALERPILPIALTGSHRVWEFPFAPRLRRGERMSLRVLAPIPAAEVCAQSADDLRRELQRRLSAAALDGVMASPRRFDPARDGYWPGYAYEIDAAFPALAADVAADRASLPGCPGFSPDRRPASSS